MKNLLSLLMMLILITFNLEAQVTKNVDVYVCPTCLKMAGFTEADLMDGVKIAQKDKFFDFTKGRIITLDY